MLVRDSKGLCSTSPCNTPTTKLKLCFTHFLEHKFLGFSSISSKPTKFVRSHRVAISVYFPIPGLSVAVSNTDYE